MDLNKWLWEKRMTKKEFAFRAGVVRKYIHDIISKRAKPSLKLAELISKITENEVTVEELIEGCYNKRTYYSMMARKRKKKEERKRERDLLDSSQKL